MGGAVGGTRKRKSAVVSGRRRTPVAAPRPSSSGLVVKSGSSWSGVSGPRTQVDVTYTAELL